MTCNITGFGQVGKENKPNGDNSSHVDPSTKFKINRPSFMKIKDFRFIPNLNTIQV